MVDGLQELQNEDTAGSISGNKKQMRQTINQSMMLEGGASTTTSSTRAAGRRPFYYTEWERAVLGSTSISISACIDGGGYLCGASWWG